MKFLILLFLIIGLAAIIFNMGNTAFGAATAGYNFCSVFSVHEECTGWRVTPIHDNFWFCEYVDLPTMCKHPPDPQKQIVPRTNSYCCDAIDFNIPKNELLDNAKFIDANQKGQLLDISSSKELLVWTEKDYYSFGERVDVYGKFNFDNPVLKTNQFVDISINNRKIILNLPVQANGWFAGYFTLSDPYLYYTGKNLISVKYFHTPNPDAFDKFTQASYQITTGNIKSDPFSIVVKHLSGKISYNIITDSGDPAKMDLAIVRLTTPDGLVLPLPSISSVKDIAEYVEILVPGNYEITVTRGNVTASQTFEYQKQL